MKTTLWFVVRLAASAGLLGLLLWRMDSGQTWSALQSARFIWVLPGLALFSLARFLTAVRFRLLISPFAKAPLSVLWSSLLIASLTNLILPGRVGDLVRVQLPANRYQVSRASLLSTVFITESLFDGLAFIALGLVAFAFYPLPALLRPLFFCLVVLVSVSLAFVFLATRQPWQLGSGTRRLLEKLHPSLPLRVETAIPDLIAGLGAFRAMRVLVPVIGLSLLIWLAEVAAFAAFGAIFQLTLPWNMWITAMIAANLLTAVPVVPSNIGGYEVAMSGLFVAFGLDLNQAATLAVTSHVLVMLCVASLGLLALWRTDISWRRREPLEDAVTNQAGAARSFAD